MPVIVCCPGGGNTVAVNGHWAVLPRRVRRLKRKVERAHIHTTELGL